MNFHTDRGNRHFLRLRLKEGGHRFFVMRVANRNLIGVLDMSITTEKNVVVYTFLGGFWLTGNGRPKHFKEITTDQVREFLADTEDEHDY